MRSLKSGEARHFSDGTRRFGYATLGSRSNGVSGFVSLDHRVRQRPACFDRQAVLVLAMITMLVYTLAEAIETTRSGWEPRRPLAHQPRPAGPDPTENPDSTTWEEVEAVGGWWNRSFNPEIDLVGADSAPIAKTIYFAGSVKWLQSPFDGRDLAALDRAAPSIPGFNPETAGLVAVSRAGVSDRIDRSRLDLVWSPEDLLDAWR
jgi:hypothetical protein